MAAEYFIARKEIQDQAWALIAANHPDLAGSLDTGELIVVFREGGAKSDGQVHLGAARKATPLANALAGENYKFIIELSQDGWEALDSKQQEANIDHHLCACRATSNQKTGDVKFSIAKPDYMVYRENVERYGMWFPKEKAEESGSDDDDDIGKMLGAGGDD